MTVGPDELPGALAFDLMLVECLTHGWDLAVATSQQAPYTATPTADRPGERHRQLQQSVLRALSA